MYMGCPKSKFPIFSPRRLTAQMLWKVVGNILFGIVATLNFWLVVPLNDRGE